MSNELSLQNSFLQELVDVSQNLNDDTAGEKYIELLNEKANELFSALKDEIIGKDNNGDCIGKVYLLISDFLSNENEYLLISNHLKLLMGVLLIEDKDIKTEDKKYFFDTADLYNPRYIVYPNNLIPRSGNKYLVSITDNIYSKVRYYRHDRRFFVSSWANEYMRKYEETIYKLMLQNNYDYDKSTIVKLTLEDAAYFKLDDEERDLYDQLAEIRTLLNKYAEGKIQVYYLTKRTVQLLKALTIGEQINTKFRDWVKIVIRNSINQLPKGKSSQLLEQIGLSQLKEE